MVIYRIGTWVDADHEVGLLDAAAFHVPAKQGPMLWTPFSAFFTFLAILVFSSCSAFLAAIPKI
jgi:hypothetical protein